MTYELKYIRYSLKMLIGISLVLSLAFAVLLFLAGIVLMTPFISFASNVNNVAVADVYHQSIFVYFISFAAGAFIFMFMGVFILALAAIFLYNSVALHFGGLKMDIRLKQADA